MDTSMREGDNGGFHPEWMSGRANRIGYHFGLKRGVQTAFCLYSPSENLVIS